MASKTKKIKTDKEREQKRCGGCDTFETADGCECRVVPCSARRLLLVPRTRLVFVDFLWTFVPRT